MNIYDYLQRRNDKISTRKGTFLVAQRIDVGTYDIGENFKIEIAGIVFNTYEQAKAYIIGRYDAYKSTRGKKKQLQWYIIPNICVEEVDKDINRQDNE